MPLQHESASFLTTRTKLTRIATFYTQISTSRPIVTYSEFVMAMGRMAIVQVSLLGTLYPNFLNNLPQKQPKKEKMTSKLHQSPIKCTETRLIFYLQKML